MTAGAMRLAVALVLAAVGLPRTAAADSFAIYKSVDRGRSWVRSDTGMPKGARINAFESAEGALIAGTDAGIFVSRDEARSWQRAAGESASSRVIAFAALGSKVFAGTDGKGLLVSSDAGGSWTSVETLPAGKVRCLLPVGAKLYAGTDAEGVLGSEDGGATWTVLGGLPPSAQVFGLATGGGRLYAALYSRGLYVRDEGEGTWTKIGDIAPIALVSVGGALVAGQNPGGLAWSESGGASWSKGVGPLHELPGEAPVWELATDGELVLAGAAEGIYASADRGRTWTRASVGLPGRGPGIAFLIQPGFVLAGVRTAGS